MRGIVRDDVDELRAELQEAIAEADVVLLSGGTGKGAGDLSYRVVRELSEPGVVAHGVAAKAGQADLPGRPAGPAGGHARASPPRRSSPSTVSSRPVILKLGGRPALGGRASPQRLAVKVNSEIGRTEYLLVGLVETGAEPAAYPMGKGSGSVTAFSRADGFITIGRHEELVEAGTRSR